MPGMDAETKDALAGAVRAALQRVPRVVWRELAKPRLRGDEVCEPLESANIKLSSVATDVFGVSGMAMLRALVEGSRSPAKMAELACGRMRPKLVALSHALEGRFEGYHRFLLGLQLDRLAAIAATIDRLDQRIDAELELYAEHHATLIQIPGVDRLGAATIIAEAGVDMSVFGNAARLAARAGVCPASHESAGKRRDGGARKGNVHLKTALVTAAVRAARVKGSYYKDKHHRLRARRSATRAAVAIAHKS